MVDTRRRLFDSCRGFPRDFQNIRESGRMGVGIARGMRLGLVLLVSAVLTACGPAEPLWAPDAEVARAVYRDDGPASLTLYTVVGKKSRSGVHSGLLVNAPSQRAIFDPAGTFFHPHLPERNDVVFGMSDAAVDFYIDYHARVTFDVIEQTVLVSPEVAELALAKVQAYGAVRKAHCADSVTDILASLPGFEAAPQTMFPNKLKAWFGTLPNATYQSYSDDSPDERGVAMANVPNLLLSN